MKLLVEDISQSQFDCEARVEGGEKHYYLKGLFLQGNSKNRNGRIYPVRVLEKAVRDYQKLIDENVSLGEIRHPKNPEDAASIDYENVTHMVKKVWKEGDNYFAEALILDTPKGKIIQELLKAGAKIGVSSRGMGSVIKENDALVVQDDYRIIALADLTSNPSAYGAMNAAVYESAEYTYDEATGEYKLMSDIMSEEKKEETKAQPAAKECECKEGQKCDCKEGETCEKCEGKEAVEEEKECCGKPGCDCKKEEKAKKEEKEVVEEKEAAVCYVVDGKKACFAKTGSNWVLKFEGDEHDGAKFSAEHTPVQLLAQLKRMFPKAKVDFASKTVEEGVIKTPDQITESQINAFKALFS